MLSWLIFGTYLAGVAIATRYYARAILNNWENDPRNAKLFADGITRADRWGALITGMAVSLFWPVVIPIHAFLMLIDPNRWLRTDREIREAERAELYRLRDLAKRYNLPMGDE